jgi:hypothetical protein
MTGAKVALADARRSGDHARMADTRPRRGTVSIAENVGGRANDGAIYLTGRFDASWQTDASRLDSAEKLTADEAIAWGRERAEDVRIRLADGARYFWAGAGPAPPDLDAWPPADPPPLRRRKAAEYASLDRTPDDPSIAWQVTAWIGPARPVDAPRTV